MLAGWWAPASSSSCVSLTRSRGKSLLQLHWRSILSQDVALALKVYFKPKISVTSSYRIWLQPLFITHAFPILTICWGGAMCMVSWIARWLKHLDFEYLYKCHDSYMVYIDVYYVYIYIYVYTIYLDPPVGHQISAPKRSVLVGPKGPQISRPWESFRYCIYIYDIHIYL